MLPWKTILEIDKTCDVPVYLQVANDLICEIKKGMIKPGAKMPGTRAMSDTLGLNRQTIVKAYEELDAQGWIFTEKSKGTFVSRELPEVKPLKLGNGLSKNAKSGQTGYTFKVNNVVHPPAKTLRNFLGFHDGPDVRLVPSKLIGQEFKSVITRRSGLQLLSYVDVHGRESVRKSISNYLNTSRGLQSTEDNIMITRGAQMAMFLLSTVLIEKNDIVIVAEINFRYADLTFLNAGAKLERVSLDEDGIVVDEVEEICKKKKVRAIYVTSHHHFPTTVTLCATRRMKLLELAEQYNFVIIEDDYDYEFHYESSPILPLASVDRCGMVVYIGSFSKTLSPAIRMGYIAAPNNLIEELSKIRQIIDAQGDPIMEQVVAEFINNGEIRRHMKKSLKAYKERRDFLAVLLKEKLTDVIEFKIPEGGLSIWAKFDKKVVVPELSDKLLKREIVLSKGLIHDLSAGRMLNSTRMGFAWMNLNEAEKAVDIMVETIKK